MMKTGEIRIEEKERKKREKMLQNNEKRGKMHLYRSELR